MSIDLAPLVQALAALALAALTAAMPYLTMLLRRYLHLNLTAAQSAALQSAADAVAQAAYGFITANAGNVRDETIRNAALAKGVQHVVATAPAALTTLGITPDQVKQIVEAKFGGLLASDPTVSISGPALHTVVPTTT